MNIHAIDYDDPSRPASVQQLLRQASSKPAPAAAAGSLSRAVSFRSRAESGTADASSHGVPSASRASLLSRMPSIRDGGGGGNGEDDGLSPGALGVSLWSVLQPDGLGDGMDTDMDEDDPFYDEDGGDGGTDYGDGDDDGGGSVFGSRRASRQGGSRGASMAGDGDDDEDASPFGGLGGLRQGSRGPSLAGSEALRDGLARLRSNSQRQRRPYPAAAVGATEGPEPGPRLRLGREGVSRAVSFRVGRHGGHGEAAPEPLTPSLAAGGLAVGDATGALSDAQRARRAALLEGGGASGSSRHSGAAGRLSVTIGGGGADMAASGITPRPGHRHLAFSKTDLKGSTLSVPVLDTPRDAAAAAAFLAAAGGLQRGPGRGGRKLNASQGERGAYLPAACLQACAHKKGLVAQPLCSGMLWGHLVCSFEGSFECVYVRLALYCTTGRTAQQGARMCWPALHHAATPFTEPLHVL